MADMEPGGGCAAQGAAQHDGGPGADAEEAAAEGWAASTQVSMLSARQKRLVLALTAVVAGLIGFPDVLARRAVNSGTAGASERARGSVPSCSGEC